ncbi:MAG TPA: hypothetical protein VGR19_04605 [Allosphingosinicella sp.]|nr:hypothetical protein [Allosphingosinicella sp.]
MAAGRAAGSGSDTAGPSFQEAHARLLADKSIQFSLDPHRPEPPPAWLRWLIEALGDIFPLLRLLFWIGVAALAAFLLFQLAKRLAGEKWPWKSAVASDDDDWRPEEGPARTLLAEADRLAAAGRFDEAAHLLLFKSIEEIEARRPKLVRPALTSRDIAGAAVIPDQPRRAFALIVLQVERSLFGGQSLQERDWQQCRTAFEEFALAKAWGS